VSLPEDSDLVFDYLQVILGAPQFRPAPFWGSGRCKRLRQSRPSAPAAPVRRLSSSRAALGLQATACTFARLVTRKMTASGCSLEQEDAMSHEDVITTALAAAGGLAGLVLVFLGIVVTTYQTYPGDAGADILKGFRHDAILTLIPFTLGIVCVCISTVWLLLSKNNEGLYIAAVVSFFLQLASLLLAAGLVTRRVLWT
jgi:hypothetical protein